MRAEGVGGGVRIGVGGRVEGLVKDMVWIGLGLKVYDLRSEV